MKVVIRTLLKGIGFLLVFVALYFIAEFSLSRIAVNDKNSTKKDVTIYLTTNGAHTDLILPMDNDIKDWNIEFKMQDRTFHYVAFGWGHKKFFLETPTWAELKVSTAITAAFGIDKNSLMKIEGFENIPAHQKTIPIYLSVVQYEQLVKHLKSYFVMAGNGDLIPVEDKLGLYGKDVRFFESNGRYHMFNTCNTWTNNTLKKVKLKACTWTAFSSGMFYIYK